MNGVGSPPWATGDIGTAAVLENNVVVGSVNANKRQWYKASLRRAQRDRAWLHRLIIRYEKPEDCIQELVIKLDNIEVVIQFSDIWRKTQGESLW